jgi:hypothetical protein
MKARRGEATNQESVEKAGWPRSVLLAAIRPPF